MKVDRAGPSECWLWRGARASGGYGYFHIPGTVGETALAHRVAFLLSGGGEPEAVCHHCDSPPCCNPAHLFGGTRADNNLDMVRKGRSRLGTNLRRGSAHHQAKLNEAAVREIRTRYAKGVTSQRGLAAEHGVSQRTIVKIVNGIGWRHA